MYTCNLSRLDSNKIEVLEQQKEECVICMDSMTEESFNNFTTFCGHNFHKDCLEKWTRQNNSCPTCRTKNVMSYDTYNLWVDTHIYPTSLVQESLFYHIVENENENTPSTPHNSNEFNIRDNIDNINPYINRNRNNDYNTNININSINSINSINRNNDYNTNISIIRNNDYTNININN